MKKILITICTGFGLCNATFATTVNYNWLVDGTNYAQTTCETGDDLILPTPSPTKYGYHFVGWVESEISGSWSQSGIPSPQNPIEPVFKPFSNTVLRAVGSGDDFVVDSYNPETRTITRRIGVKVFDGTENWIASTAYNGSFFLASAMTSWGAVSGENNLCTHFSRTVFNAGNKHFYVVSSAFNGATDFNQWLADQYNAGTPVTVYYPLETPTEERIQ